MANGFPYFRWFPADAENDEKYVSLNDQELGFFHRCLNKSWPNYGLPSDTEELASLMKVTPKYLSKIWPKVSRCFLLTETVHPRLVNPRQEKERDHALKKSASATKNVRNRYGRKTDEHNGNNGSNGGVTSRALARADSDSDTEADSVSNSSKELPEKPSPVLPIEVSEFPITLQAIHRIDPAADEMFLRRLVQVTLQACLSDDAITKEQIEAITDEWIAKAVLESFARFKGRGGHGAGLLLSRVPQIIKTWCRED